MFGEDLNAFFDGLDAVPVTFAGAESGLVGYEDFADMAQLGQDGYGEVIGRRRTVLLRSDAATLLRPGMSITINGMTRKVLDPKAQDDGAFTTVTVQ